MAKIEAVKISDREVLTGEARIAFPHVFEAFAFPGQDKKKFSVALMIPKGDPSMAMFASAVKTVIDEKWPGGRPKGEFWNPIQDGDGQVEKYPERAGHWIINAGSSEKFPPVVVDRNKAEIMDQREIYSGCFCRAKIGFYAFQNIKKGVGVSLNVLQKLRDGDPFGGARPTASDLPDLEPAAKTSAAVVGDDDGFNF